jgi:preprotein translocase subunit SecG
MVLIQNEDGDSLGGIFAGGSSSAFGSRSGNVLTKTTSILGAIFLITSFGLALVNRTPGDTGVETAAKQLQTTTQNGASNNEWWNQDTSKATSPDAAAPATSVPAPATSVPAPATSVPAQGQSTGGTAPSGN